MGQWFGVGEFSLMENDEFLRLRLKVVAFGEVKSMDFHMVELLYLILCFFFEVEVDARDGILPVLGRWRIDSLK